MTENRAVSVVRRDFVGPIVSDRMREVGKIYARYLAIAANPSSMMDVNNNMRVAMNTSLFQQGHDFHDRSIGRCKHVVVHT